MMDGSKATDVLTRVVTRSSIAGAASRLQVGSCLVIIMDVKF